MISNYSRVPLSSPQHMRVVRNLTTSRPRGGGKWNKGKKRAQEEEEVEEVLGHRGHGWLVCTPILRMAILDRGCPGWRLEQDERTLRGHYLDGKHTWTVWFVLPSRPHITARPLCIGMRFLFKWESIRISRRTRGQNDASKTFLLPDTNQRFLSAEPRLLKYLGWIVRVRQFWSVQRKVISLIPWKL